MANQSIIKITQLSKDFNMKAKDIIEAFKDMGLEKKTGGSVDVDEFELFMSVMTKKHQIKKIESELLEVLS